jgi:hypothetical protein
MFVDAAFGGPIVNRLHQYVFAAHLASKLGVPQRAKTRKYG